MNAEVESRQVESADTAGPTVGAQLRAAREGHELTISDVAYSLKLNPRQVEALESNRFDLLPGRAFARGFLKNYARFLGLDADSLLRAVDQAEGVAAKELSPVSNAQGTMPSPDERLRPSVVPAALVALALMIVVAGGWYFDWFQQPEVPAELADPDARPEAPVPQMVAPAAPATDATGPVVLAPIPTMVQPAESTAAEAEAPIAPSEARAAPAEVMAAAEQPAASEDGGVAAQPEADPTAVEESTGSTAAVEAADAADEGETAEVREAPAPPEPVAAAAEARVSGQHSLVFRFAKDAWVEVRDASGRVIMSRIGKAGTADEVQGKPPFALVVGNAAHVALEHDGQAVDLAPHTRVSVARLKLE